MYKTILVYVISIVCGCQHAFVFSGGEPVPFHTLLENKAIAQSSTGMDRLRMYARFDSYSQRHIGLWLRAIGAGICMVCICNHLMTKQVDVINACMGPYVVTVCFFATVIFALHVLEHKSDGTYLCLAMQHNDRFALYDLLYNRQINPNSLHKHKKRPLHIAAEKGDIEAAKLLIKKNARIDIQDTRGNTPLHVAAQSGMYDVLELFCLVGASLHRKNKQGKMPIHVAHDGRCIRILLQYGTNPYISDNNRRNAYSIYDPHAVERYALYRHVENSFAHCRNANLQKLLASFGAYLCITSDKVMYNRLLPIIQIPDVWLIYAIWCRHTDIIDILLSRLEQTILQDQGAINKIIDDHHNGVLHVAAQYDEPDMLTQLLALGADTWAMNNNHEIPYDIATKHGHHRIQQLMKEHHQIDCIVQPHAPISDLQPDQRHMYMHHMHM